jgi:hypothetical protein
MNRIDKLGMAFTMALALLVVVRPAGADDPLPIPAQALEWTPRSIVARQSTEFTSAPRTPPGGAPADNDPSLHDVQRYMKAADTHRALKAAQALTKHKRWGRDRDAAWLVIGLLNREAGRHNLASEAFTKVRLADGPLAAFGAFYEAEQDLTRGKPHVAIRECQQYVDSWPEGPHASACQRVIAKSYAELGISSRALETAEAYDEEHENAPISEQIELALAQWEVANAPDRAIRRLKKLAIEHEAPLTGRLSAEWLDELQAAGHEDAAIPDDDSSLRKRAVSLRDAGNRHAAWAAFERLKERAGDDTWLKNYVEQEADVFAWRTRNYDFLEKYYKARYDKKATGEDAWNRYRALSRDGQWQEAADAALAAQTGHPTTRNWRRSQEDVGRTMLLAKRYDEAQAQFETVRKRGGWSGRRGEFFGAFAALMADDLVDAEERFTTIIKKNRSYLVESRYWRARTLERADRAEEAQPDRAWIKENAPASWYSLLLSQDNAEAPTLAPFLRDGAWPGTTTPAQKPSNHRISLPTQLPVASWARPQSLTASSALALFRWTAARPEPNAPQSIVSLLRVDPLRPPSSYRASVLFDEHDAQQAFSRHAAEHETAWTDLPAIHDLARAGLYDLSGPMFSAVFEDWREAWRQKSHPAHESARAIKYSPEDWRELFLFTRDHHHSMRYVHGMSENLTDEALAQEAVRLEYPLAHDRFVWTHAHEHGIDPYLVLGLMRQESTYNAIATSRVGARGAMQIMPRTGNLLADRLTDVHYTSGDLEDPIRAVGYGITYLGLLMDRYDGVYPLAIASYNGGPHNVSRWLGGTGMDMPMDEFVEHIPFRETRNYVKLVSEGYGTYLTAYAPQDTAIVLPAHARANDPEVVDF